MDSVRLQQQLLLQPFCTSRLRQLTVEGKQLPCAERSRLVKRQIISKICWASLEVGQCCLNFHCAVQVNGWLLGKRG